MRIIRWDDPKILRIGKELAEDAFNMADELGSYGADAEAYLMSEAERRRRAKNSEGGIRIPLAFADALMALLLALPRKGDKRGRRSLWSIARAQKLLDSGMSKHQIAKQLSKETGLDADNIRSRLRKLKKAP
jgi:hypothetical protein